MRVPVYNPQGKRTDEILEFEEHIFGDEIRTITLKEAILMYEARQRQGTSCTKTRKDVAGSGRKLWRQKHTGRARVGPARAPHWRGGGRVFGPHPRNYSYAIPKKARRVALDSAWLAKLQDKEIMVIEGFNVTDTPKTSTIFDTFCEMGVAHRRLLIGIMSYDEVLWKSVRNIERASLEQISHFSPHALLGHERIILVKNAFEELIKSRGGEVHTLKRQDLYKKSEAVSTAS